MRVIELIAELSALPEHLEVYLYTDHGQRYEDATSVVIEEDPQDDWDMDEVDGPVVAIYGL